MRDEWNQKMKKDAILRIAKAMQIDLILLSYP